MSNKISPVFITIAALAFIGAGVTSTVESTQAEQAAEQTKTESTRIASLGSELKERYDVQFTEQQLKEMSCTAPGFLGMQDCYNGNTDSIKYYGTTQYTKENGTTVTINLLSTAGGPAITENTQ